MILKTVRTEPWIQMTLRKTGYWLGALSSFPQKEYRHTRPARLARLPAHCGGVGRRRRHVHTALKKPTRGPLRPAERRAARAAERGAAESVPASARVDSDRCQCRPPAHQRNCRIWEELPHHVPASVLSGRVWRGVGALLACLRSDRHCRLQHHGETLHRTLSLPVPLTTELPELAGEQLQALQARLEGLRLLLIDEMSMVGRKLLRTIDLRLRQAFPHRATEPFGGTSICLLGDFGQLPPVLDRPMYDTAAGGGRLSEDGRATFRVFSKAVILQRVERVRGDDPAQE